MSRSASKIDFTIPEFSSIAQASGATGIPLDVLKHAKRSGCLAFKHGRVDLVVFLRWFFAQDSELGGEEVVDWTKRKNRAAALREEARLEREREEVVDWKTAERFVRKLVAQMFFGELDRLRSEFPAGLKGKTEVDIAAEVDKQVEIVKASLDRDLETWVTNKGKEKL